MGRSPRAPRSAGTTATRRPRGSRRAAPSARLEDFPDAGIPTGAGVMTLMQSIDDANVVVVLLDGIESSALHLSDPTVLDFEYMDLMTRALTALPVASTTPLRTLHVGGAACALPRAWAHVFPGSHNLVAEIDPDLARLAREWFDLPRSPAVRIRVGDGRAVVETQREASTEVVVRDAFDRGVVPLHMRTRQFIAQVRRVLAPGGAYLVNLADSVPLTSARAEAAALAEQFAHVCLLADPGVLSGRRFGNVVLVASDAEVPVADVDRAVRGFPLPITVLDDAQVRDFATAPVPDDAGLAQEAGVVQPRLDAHPG